MDKVRDKRVCGIILAFLLSAVFVAISLSVNTMINGTPWFVFSSCMRVAFGVLILILAKKIYGRSAKEVFCFRNSRQAFIAASGFLMYFIYCIVMFGVGIKSMTGLSAGIFFSRILLQQLTTGFYEEIHYRLLMCEGYRFTKGGALRKIGYALISSVLFASIHILGGWNTGRFLQTGAMGFAFAVIYLSSGNILLPMILHFVYDILANLNGFIEWNFSAPFNFLNGITEIMLAAMFLISFIILIRKDNVPSALSSAEG